MIVVRRPCPVRNISPNTSLAALLDSVPFSTAASSVAELRRA